MIARPDVDTLLAGPLGKWLGEQANVRELAKREAARRWWKAAIIAGPIFIFVWLLIPGLFQLKLFATVAVGALGAAWGNAPRARAIKTVKTGINEAIARSLGLTYSAEVVPGSAFDLARTYELLPRYDSCECEDDWCGDIGGRSFELHEAHLREKRSNGKNTRWVTVFRGAIMQIDFSREFHGTTLVERAGQHRSLFGGRKDSIALDGRRLDHVDMVNPEFNDEFCVYSDDQVEARYLVHPEYVERLIALRSAFAGEDIRAVFSAGNLVIVVDTTNMFESGSIEARDDRSRIERTVGQFTSLANLAQSLNERERGVIAG